VTWREWLKGKTSVEVFHEVGKRMKAGTITPEQAKKVWSTYREINEPRIYQDALDPNWWSKA
jgi:hypothetical protein